MEQKLYQDYLKRWDIWLKDEEAYFKKRKHLVAKDASEEEFKELEKFYGHDAFNSRQFGPFTIIYDKEDLLNQDFILPGCDVPFCKLKNTDQNIPFYWGKEIFDDYSNKIVGRVIGYGYDYSDDYIIARDNITGKETCVMVNSRYRVIEENENG